jgi:DNA polymerase-3 subunit epsilon
LFTLEQSLEDRTVNEFEAVQLQELAISLGLSGSQMAEAHRAFLGNVARIAMADGELSPSESRDYLRVAQLLGMSDESAMELLNAVNSDPTSLPTEDLSGKSVCFTGDSQCRMEGQRIDKNLAEELAAGAGLKVAKSVTKKLDILVVADPDSMSGKAKKAREYGTRILAERVFWPKIGVFVG